MKAQDARDERLLLLDAWRESAIYTERERAALAWTDALTEIAKTHAPDATLAEVRRSSVRHLKKSVVAGLRPIDTRIAMPL